MSVKFIASWIGQPFQLRSCMHNGFMESVEKVIELDRFALPSLFIFPFCIGY